MSDRQGKDTEEKDTWRVKSLDEIREERKKKQQQKSEEAANRKKEQIPAEIVIMDSASSEHDEDQDKRERHPSSGDDRIEVDALNIQPPQRQAQKDHKSRRRDDKRKHGHSHRDSEKRRRDKRSRNLSGEKRGKHREERRDRTKDKSSSRSHKERSKDPVRPIKRLLEEKRKDRREERREDYIPPLMGPRGSGRARERDLYKTDREPLSLDRKLGRDRLDHHQEDLFDRQKREERQRESYWRDGGRMDSRERSRDWPREQGRGRDGSRDLKLEEGRRREEAQRQPEQTRRIVSLVDRPPRGSEGKGREERGGSSQQRDRSVVRKEKEGKDTSKEKETERKVVMERDVNEEEERPISDFELEKESRGEAPETEEQASSEESEDSDGSDESSEESDSSEEEEEDEGEEEKDGVEKEEGEASASEESSSEEEGSDEESEEEEESGEESEGSEESPEEETANVDTKDASASKFDKSPKKEEGRKQDQSMDGEDGYMADSPEHSPAELKEELPAYFPALSGCRNVEEFEHLNKIEEGTYGVVYRAREKRNNEIVALKRLKMEKEKEGFPITSLREINTLLKAQHINIVTVREIVVGSNMDKIYIVMDYVEHDLKSLMETMKQPFTIGETKCLLQQLLRGVHHLHDNWILHRDLKTSNLLLSHKGILKIGDFGLAREYGSPLKQYTPIVVTLWYRAPELLLGIKEYSVKIDMWSVGCIFAEFLTMKPLFPGRSEIDQLNRIFKELGTPSEKIWPGYNELPAVKKMSFTEHPYNNLRNRFGTYLTDLGFDLLNRFLTYNPTKRISAEESLVHEYFKESPLPIDESMFPTWPAKSEQTRSTKRSPKAPEGGMQYNKLGDDEGEGFRLTLPSHGTSAVGPGFSLKF